ncbi:hypothetical protein GE09DRAFT_1192910 [Coniochaeta sp. 2T2.1]|nr:hypothetical protein GE09DRAFT_1192910 [Coniochaeta sp. 2T2.1]
MNHNRNTMSTFRASCDNCATSKVRCGKEQPYCQRCFRLGQICIYSPSQRSRRRTHRPLDQADHVMDPTRNHNTGNTASVPTGYLTPPLLGTSATDMQNNMDMTSGTSPSDFMNMLDDAGSNGLFADFDTNHPSLQCNDLAHNISDKHEGQQQQESDRRDNPGDNNGGLFSDFDSNNHPSLHRDLTHGTLSARHEGHPDSDSRQEGHKSSLLFASGLAMETTITALSSSAGASSSNASSRSGGSASDEQPGQQHCELAILHMLMELGTPSPCRGRPRSSRDLGAILKTGRKTLACASRVLECNTCPRSTNAALLVTTLLLRTLSWYELILQEQDTTMGSGGSNDNSATGGGGGGGSDYGGMIVDEISPGMSLSESDSLGEPPGGSSVSSSDAATGIVVPPMLIGSYELDAESQGRMVCHVILGDLRKIDGLAKSVSAKLRDAETAAAAAPSSSPEASQAPELMAAVIRQRHGQLLRVIERKLEIHGV